MKTRQIIGNNEAKNRKKDTDNRKNGLKKKRRKGLIIAIMVNIMRGR